MNKEKITIPANDKHLLKVMGMINNKIEQMNCTLRTRTQIRVAVDEILCNIVRYAYRGKEGIITVEAEENENPPGIAITFVDQGIPFNPLNAQEPDLTGSAKKHRIGWWGVYIVKNTMDRIDYEYKDGSNVFTIWKYV